ncbi:tetratricopeptide repeat protein [bacterium]|nr:MAG: tetratricopeptide repeat protein [bacterium]
MCRARVAVMRNPIFRTSLSSCRAAGAQGMKGVFFLLTVAASWPLLSRTAEAQKLPLTAPVPEPVLAPVARPAAPVRTVNVLIVALDDETTIPQSVPSGDGPPLTAAPPIAPDIPLTAITPARFNGMIPEWRAYAAKKPKPTPTPDARFFAIPAPPSTAPLVSGGRNSPPAQVGGGVNPLDNMPPVPLPLPPRSFTPTGRAMLAALPLAHALTALGYADVQATAPDGGPITRALGERRLPLSTLATLRDSLKSLQGATKLPEALRKTSINVATKRAANAAAAVGQATGYRAVVALYVGSFADGTSPYAVVLGDSANETGEPLLWSETAANEAAARETGATSGAALLNKSLEMWPAAPASLRPLADVHIERARAAGTAGNLDVVRDEVTRALALDSSRTDAYILLGDFLAPTDLIGAAAAYKRAVDLNSKDGKTYEKMAVAYANAPTPDWTRTLEAGKKALAAGTDTASLRIAMARAYFGRADVFRRNVNLGYRADDAEAEAQIQLDRALQLSPDNPDALRLLARSLMSSGRVTEAVQTLDRVMPLFPKDIDLQGQYAQALMSLGDRKEATFSAYSKLWKLSANTTPQVDPVSYAALVEGFDEHVFALGKSARLLSDGVATGSIARESAFLQLARLKEDMSDAEDTISTLIVPTGFSATAATARQFAATLMNQALEAHQTFLDTGQVLYRGRAAELYRQAVAQLNMARNAK